MYSTFDTYNPTKEDLIANAPEGATHYQPPRNYSEVGTFWKVVPESQATEVWCLDSDDGSINYHFCYPDGNDCLQLERCIEIPARGVIEENPTVIRERILEIRKEREAGIKEEQDLIDKLASMGFKLIEDINEKLEEAKEQHDLQDPRNWEVGDLLERINDEYPAVYTPGGLYQVKQEHPKLCVYDNFGGDSSCLIDEIDYDHFKFHSRPTK